VRPHGSDSATEPDENDRSRGNREPRGEDQSFPPTDRKAFGFAETLRRQFRQLAQSLTRRESALQPTQRRKREEVTRGAFQMAVRTIMRRIRCVLHAKPPAFEPPEPERLWLSDTMDWNRLWADNNDMSAFQFSDDPVRPDNFFDQSSDFPPDL
jgi:hypothetical protein